MKPKLKCVMPETVVLERQGVFQDAKDPKHPLLSEFHETTGIETLIRHGHMYAWPTIGRPFRVIVGLTRAYETRRVIRKRWEKEGVSMVFDTPDSRYEVSVYEREEDAVTKVYGEPDQDHSG